MLLVIGLLVGMLSVHAQTWYLEDFESLGIMGPTKPEGWEVPIIGYNNAFQLHTSQGVDGSQTFYAQLQDAEERYFITQALNLGEEPLIEFQYKTTGIVGEAPANCLSLKISLIIGEDTTAVKTVSAQDYVAASTYAPMKVVLDKTAYASKQAKVMLGVSRAGSDNCYFYIDNLGVGTKPESVANDLMIQGEIAGPAMPTVNTESEYTFTVFNNGTAAQTVYSVQLLNGVQTLLAKQDITESLAAGASAEHTLRYTPTQAGADTLYAVVVLSGDQNAANDTASLKIEVQAVGNTVVEVGKGFILTGTVPFGFTSETNAALILYSAEDLNSLKGSISALMFDGRFRQTITCATQVYIGETDEGSIPFDENLTSHFIDPVTLTKVFDGEMTFPEGDHQSIRINFTNPFEYSGEKTLAVYTFSKISPENVLEDYTANQFYAVSTMGGSTMVITTGGTNVDPMRPDAAGGSPVFQRPNTMFVFSSVSDEKYNLSFTVKDADGQAVSDAVITLNGECQDAGKYAFEQLPARRYAYVVEKEGFIPARGSLLLNKDTTLAVTLADMADYPGLSGFLFEDFENISQNKRPLNWMGSFYVDEQGGKNNGHRLTHSFWYLDGPRDIVTNPIFMGSEPVFEFEYRVMDYQTYPQNAFTGQNLTWSVAMSEDFGETWEILYNEDYGQHVSSKDYKPFSIDVSEYAGKICQFWINVNRDNQKSDEFYFDIDNLKIGTQLTNDLAVVSKVEGMRVPGAGEKNVYTVSVRNEGTAAAENYSLKFYDGQNEIGSVAGTRLEGGAFANLTFEHTFAAEGEHTLTARCVMDNDELTINNATSELYVSVQSQGVRSSMVEAYEGEDMAWYAPLSVYDNNSLDWILYNKNDLSLKSGDNISGMAFRTKFGRATERMHLAVYIGETSINSLLQGVPVPTSLTKVFDGGVSIDDKDGGNFVVNFDRAYPYKGRNIVVALYKESSDVFGYDVECGFSGYYSLDAISVINMRSEEPMDLSDTLSQQELLTYAAFCKPSTIFLLNDNVSYHTVTFEVTDQNGAAVTNATLTFDGTVMAAGKYRVENVPDGTYAYSVSLNGEVVEGEVTVNGADVVEKVQLQHVANESKEENMVSIYPNPTNGKLHIEVAEGAKEINLYDISGRMVRRLNRVPAGVIEMDLTDCHSGIYLLKIDNRAFKVCKR